MCLITLFVGIIGFALYWLGFLDRPKFQVVESLLGLSKDDADASKEEEKGVYAIVATAQDEDYVDNHTCSVLRATKKGIEASIQDTDESDANRESNKGGDAPSRPVTVCSSYSVTGTCGPGGRRKGSAGKSTVPPHEDDKVGISIFLQDPATGDCHETAVGFLVEASSREDAAALAHKVAKSVQEELGGEEEQICSSDAMGSSSSSESARARQANGFFRVKAVSLGNGPVFRGRIPIRNWFAVYVARYLQWGRAHTGYTALMSNEESAAQRKLGAVACEVYVNGLHNPAIGGFYVDYLYLLDPRDREAVWKQLETPLP